MTRAVKDNAISIDMQSVGYDAKDGTSAGASVPNFTAGFVFGDIKGMKVAFAKRMI